MPYIFNWVAYLTGLFFALGFVIIASSFWVQLGYTWGGTGGAAIHSLAWARFFIYLVMKWK